MTKNKMFYMLIGVLLMIFCISTITFGADVTAGILINDSMGDYYPGSLFECKVTVNNFGSTGLSNLVVEYELVDPDNNTFETYNWGISYLAPNGSIFFITDGCILDMDGTWTVNVNVKQNGIIIASNSRQFDVWPW